jgi:membrane protease subunit HflC
MTADCYVLWEITDAKKFVQTLNGSISTAESRIDTLVYNSIKNTISNMTQDEVIQSRDDDINVATNDSELENLDNVIDIENNVSQENNDVEIKNLSKDIMSNFKDVEEQYGIVVKIVDLKVLDLPNENKNAVYERMIAERENISAQYTAMGESEAQIIRNTADKKVSILLSEANATADKLVAEGEAEYMRILSEAYNDQEKADFYLYVRSLDALKTTMKQGNNNTIVLNEDSPIAQIFSNID